MVRRKTKGELTLGRLLTDFNSTCVGFNSVKRKRERVNWDREAGLCL